MNNISKHIASKMKLLRIENGWSLDKTSEATGVSKAMLGQIERQESSPTVATLWKIATGFNKSFSFFLDDVESNEFTSAQNIKSDEKIIITTLFAFDPKSRCEIFIIDLLPSCEHLSIPHKAGIIEHIIVAKGTIEVLLNNKWQILREGEGIGFNADQHHGYRNLTSTIARFHNIIHYPEFISS